MMWWYQGMSQYGWGMLVVNGLITLLLWSGGTALVVWAILSFTRNTREHREPLEILRHRFAAGEINETEFEQAKRSLQG